MAIALSQDGEQIVLWARDEHNAKTMQESRLSGPKLPGPSLPDSLSVTADSSAFDTEICLLAVPMQKLAMFLAAHPYLNGKTLIACCKGIDLNT
ncbi:MAG: hypothetical protein ABJ258_00050, partial [Marinomonas sp.]